MDYIETKTEGLSAEQVSAIASDSRGTTLYVRCDGGRAHSSGIQWLHETLDIVVFATPDDTDINGVNVAVRARCGAFEVITETIPVDDVTELSIDEDLDYVGTWLRENLVRETGKNR